MSTKAVLSSRESYKSSSVTLNHDVDDKYHSCTTSIDESYLDPESGSAKARNSSKLCNTQLLFMTALRLLIVLHNIDSNDFQESDIETLNDMYYEPKIDPESGEKNGIYPWLVVLGTFLVLIVGLGAGSGW